MSILLYVIGALAVIAGASAILFGVPIKEFSLGDTLILSGTVSLIGGLIVIGLGAAVSQLQRVAELLDSRSLSRGGRSADVLDGSRGRVPFPPRPKSEAARPPATELPPFVPAPVEEQPEIPAAAPAPEAIADTLDERDAAPAIRNPDLALPEEPVEEARPSPPPFRFPDLPKPPSAEPARAAPLDVPPWRRPAPARSEPAPQPSYFDAMWDNEQRTAPEDTPVEPERLRSDTIARAPVDLDEPPPPPEPEMEEVPPADEPPRSTVAVLKSGVVDGMGYTLYVDGSIEAELPDGTLRFASINELRAHLERTG